ncbi:MAG: PAS domain S-box protein [Bacteroidota bacterium]
MNFVEKTKEELIEELQTILQEHDELKALYEKDITSLRNAEEKLKLSEERQREVLENSLVAAYKRNLQSNDYEYISPVFVRLTGYTPEEMKTLPLETVIGLMHPDDMPEVERTLAGAISKGAGQTNQVEYRFRHKKGVYRWLIDRFTLVNDCQNKPVALIGSISDITERKLAEEALRVNEEKHRILLQTAMDGFWLADNKGQILEVNGTYVQMSGYSADELVTMKISDLEVVESEADTVIHFQKILSQGEDRFETRHRRKNGTTYNVEVSVQYKPVDGGLFVAFIRDITERKKAEQALAESEEKYRVLLNGSIYGILAADAETRQFLFSNPAICKLFGYTDEEFRRLNIGNLVPKESLDLVMSEFDSQMRGAKSVSFAQACVRKDGTIFYADIAGAPIVLNGRKCSVGFFNDVSDRIKSEEKIHEKDIQFKKLSSHLPDLIYQFTRRPDGSYCVPIASEGIKNIFGCSPEDVVDDFTPIGRVIVPEDAERVISDIEYSAKHLTCFTCEFRVQIPGKPVQWMLSKSTPEKLEDGSVTWYGFNANITAMKQTEMQLIKAKEKAEESDRLKSAFLANMSHEIRTPMNGILGFAGLLKEPHLTGKEQQQYISVIERSGKRMLNIINDLVSISKIEAGQMNVLISASNINEQIESIHNFFTPEVEKKGLQLSIKNTLPSNDCRIKTDREKLFAILTNLVGNALKFTNAGSIEIGAEKKGDFIEFFVKDTGMGVPEHKKEVIFERFRQGSELITKPYEGAGLGLSIAKGYVEMLGGKLWLESELGKGSTFYFTLPYNIKNKVTTVIEDTSSGAGITYQASNLKILIVEDDEASVLFLSTVLNIYCKEILTAGTGIEAVEACRNNPDIDLVLMDVRMPDLDGYSATRQIRQFNKNVVIIMQTAYAMSGDRENSIKAGCNDFISKPFIIEELNELMRKHFPI